MKILPEAPKLIKKGFSDEDLVSSSQISNLMWGFPAWFEGFFVTAHLHLAPFFNVRVRAPLIPLNSQNMQRPLQKQLKNTPVWMRKPTERGG